MGEPEEVEALGFGFLFAWILARTLEPHQSRDIAVSHPAVEYLARVPMIDGVKILP